MPLVAINLQFPLMMISSPATIRPVLQLKWIFVPRNVQATKTARILTSAVEAAGRPVGKWSTCHTTTFPWLVPRRPCLWPPTALCAISSVGTTGSVPETRFAVVEVAPPRAKRVWSGRNLVTPSENFWKLLMKMMRILTKLLMMGNQP